MSSASNRFPAFTNSSSTATALRHCLECRDLADDGGLLCELVSILVECSLSEAGHCRAGVIFGQSMCSAVVLLTSWAFSDHSLWTSRKVSSVIGWEMSLQASLPELPSRIAP